MARLRRAALLSTVCFAIATHVQAGTSETTTAATSADQDLLPPSSQPLIERDRAAPIDYGFGPGVARKPATRTASRAAFSAMSAPAGSFVPPGGATAHVQGVFGPPITWPLIGIHLALLPDGRVISYGTNERGLQGAQLVYSVWDPSLGTEASAHMVLPNTTATDIFCSGQTVISTTGQLLITGGDRTIDGKRNYSNEQTQLFDPQTNTIQPNGAMVYARWYPTLVHMPNDDVLILGGRQDPQTAASVPEVFNATTGWRTLTNAASLPAFGFKAKNWFYPKAFVMPSGRVFVLGNDGVMFSVNTAGAGGFTRYAVTTLPGDYTLPSVMYAPGRVLSLRAQSRAIVVNLETTRPQATETASIDQVRYWSNATVMADGQVMVNGGSTAYNQLADVAVTAQIWNPATGAWTTGATAGKPRLYHSSALLLPDGTVLTGAGGAPGPVKNLNMEIFYPPYLYKTDGSGEPAERPVIDSAPAIAHLGQPLTATLGGEEGIERVTMVRSGSVTHSFNPDQRFIPLTFTQEGTQVTATLPADARTMVPGYYLLFVFRNGTPSVAKIVHVII